MTGKETDIEKAAQEIRKAWKAGKKEVTIDDVKLSIRQIDHQITVEQKDAPKLKRTESWLVASPVGSKYVPMYNVEMDPGKNSRVIIKK